MVDVMARRVTAMIGIVVIIGLALMLIWRVYLHHRQIRLSDDDSALVRLSSPSSHEVRADLRR